MVIKRILTVLLVGMIVFGATSSFCLAAQADEEADITEATEETVEADAIEVSVSEDGTYTFTYGDMTWTFPADSEDASETAATGTVVNVTSWLNLRSGAGTDYSILGHLLNGTEVEVVGQDGDWYEVVVTEQTGYVSGDYLEVLEVTDAETDSVEDSNSESTDESEEVTTSDLLTLLLSLMTDNTTEAAETSSGGLTSNGNLTLVDDIGSSTEAGRQFITVQSKNGNTFYLIIDRDEDGDENVYFLNLVDESDLLALMDEDEVAEYQAIQEVTNTDEDFTDTSTTVVEATAEPEPEAEEEAETESGEQGTSRMVIIVILVAALIAGVCAYMFTQKQKQKQAAERPDPDADYMDEDEEDYDLPEFYDEDDIGFEDDEPV